MSSNRLKLLLLSVMAVVAISAVASASASAGCYRVAVKETGNYKTRSAAGVCEEKGAKREYIKATVVGPVAGEPGVWCAKVEEAGTGTFEDAACTKPKEGGEFIKVKATCYPVAEPETGRFKTSATCEARTPVIAKGAWINISKLENEIKPGEWCAKVETAKTGNYKDNKCTEKMGEGEFIKVKVSVDEWEVQKCEKVTAGSGLFTSNTCETLGAPKEFAETGALEKLAAGKKRSVTSSGGEFKLTSGTKVITCKKIKDEGTITGGKPGTDLASTITFTECTTSQAGCNVKSAGGTLKTIVVTNIPTKLQQFLVGEEEILGDIFEQKTVENAKKELIKEFVTLEFEGTCSEFPETKVKGDVVAEVVPGTGELNFPATPIEITPHLEAFGIKATLTGKDTQTGVGGGKVQAS